MRLSPYKGVLVAGGERRVDRIARPGQDTDVSGLEHVPYEGTDAPVVPDIPIAPLGGKGMELCADGIPVVVNGVGNRIPYLVLRRIKAIAPRDRKGRMEELVAVDLKTL